MSEVAIRFVSYFTNSLKQSRVSSPACSIFFSLLLYVILVFSYLIWQIAGIVLVKFDNI